MARTDRATPIRNYREIRRDVETLRRDSFGRNGNNDRRRLEPMGRALAADASRPGRAEDSPSPVMGYRHRGHQGKPDANTKGIVDELRELEISVRFIGKPVDLIVGYAGLSYLIEIKNPDGKDKRGKSWEDQLKFMEEWRGQVCVCHNTAEVLQEIDYRKV